MKNKNIKVIDEHNIDRNANIMFAVDLNGSEYVVYWIERDETSNNVFVSKILKNLDGTYNMLNIDDTDKKRDVSEDVKFLISSAVSDQSDKLVGLTKTLSNGETAKFISVSFNKEQNINVPKTYITTVKKEVTKVVEDYYDVISNETEIETVLTPVNTAAPEPVVVPEVVESITTQTAPVAEPVVTIPTPAQTQPELVVVAPEVAVAPAVVAPVVEAPAPVLNVTPEVQPTPVVTVPVESVANVVETVATIPTSVQTQPELVVVMPEVAVAPAVAAPVVETPTPVLNVTPEVQPTPVVTETVIPAVNNTQPLTQAPEMTIVSSPAVAPVLPEATPVNSVPVQQPVLQPESVVVMPEVVAAPVVSAPVVETPVVPTPVASTPIVNTTPVAEQPLVFNAAKETNLNAALGEVANSNNVPVQNINVVREFGEEAPVVQAVVQPAVAPMVQSTSAVEPKLLVKKAGFANSKFFMVVAVAFFMASCVFLGYEVFNYFQITTK